MPKEKTLVLIKPDGVMKRIIGEIFSRFEKKGLRIAAVKMLSVSIETAERHYSVHKGKPFYGDLIDYITSGPVIAMVLEGNGAIAVVRKMIGSTDGSKAEPGTIRGDVVGPSNNPPTVVSEFKAQIIILHHQNVIAKGYTPVFHIHTAQIACTITEILEKKDPKTGQVVEQNPETIKTGDIAIVKIKPTKPICAEKYSDFPQLGRFAIRDMGETVGAGVILDVTPAQGK